MTIKINQQTVSYSKLMKAVQYVRGDVGMYVHRDYDLRASLDTKCFEAYENATWTAFINVKGTLAHIVCPNAELLVRITFREGIQHMSTSQMHHLVTTRCGDYIKL